MTFRESDRRELEPGLAALVKNVRDHAIFTMDLSGRVSLWTAPAEAILGFAEGEAVGQHSSFIFSEEDKAAGIPEKELRTALETGRADDQRWHVRKGGERFWAVGSMTLTTDATGVPSGFLKIIRDETARKRAELELERLNADLEARIAERTSELVHSETTSRRRADRLRDLAAELGNFDSRQRRDISRLLHDHVQQLLVAYKMQVQLLIEGCQDEQLKNQMTQAFSLLDDSINATRNLSVQLDPPLLHDQGLVPALEWLIDRMKRQYGLTVTSHFDDDDSGLNEEQRDILFQAAQEFFLNAAKHSGTKDIGLRFLRSAEQFWLEIRDAGRGFDPVPVEEGKGSFGLFRLRQRLEASGGSLTIESAPGRGTAASASLPRGNPAFASQQRINAPARQVSDRADQECRPGPPDGHFTA